MLVAKRKKPQTSRRTRITHTLRVMLGERFVGDILLNSRGRIWRHADSVPTEVVLKILLAHTRNEQSHGLAHSRDGRVYDWAIWLPSETEELNNDNDNND